MTERSFRADRGGDESLDDLLARLKADLARPRSPVPPELQATPRMRRWRPPDAGHFVTSRRPLGGAGGAEAPVPVETPAPDCNGGFQPDR